MPRGPAYTPQTCPWAALVKRGLVTYRRASSYRTGAAVPGGDRIALYNALGFDMTVEDGLLICSDWPEKEDPQR
jgi:hypothetical protein